jgi:2-polyprenyl-3-methyl-5-hydroxy-6-metoxy-1,4-benzoquinol methylase
MLNHLTAPLPPPTIGEAVLYRLAKALYRSEIAHSAEMKVALSDVRKADDYRAREVARVLEAARRFDVRLRDRDVLDLGCNDGAMTIAYAEQGARSVIGADTDAAAIATARRIHSGPSITYVASGTSGVPIASSSVDTILCFDVFEHVSHPDEMLAECRRVLRTGGKLLIGTWGWYHPFAPHLWATMPVPWAHVLFSEPTLLRACRRVFHSKWYVPNRHDVDASGRKYEDKYTEESISTDYLNKLLIRDFERAFGRSGLAWRVHPEPFGSRYARWSRTMLRVPLVREFMTSYFWAVLEKR